MLISTQTSAFLTRVSGRLIYGTIILGAVIGSLSDPLPRNLRVIVIVVLSLYVVSLASAYARTIDADMVARRATPWLEQWTMLLKPGWVMSSTIVPITFFGLAMTGLISQETALTATRFGLMFVLLFFGFISRRLCGGGVLQSLGAGPTVAMLGLVVVQIKLWTKYLPAIGY
jgi:uncharacterized protein YhhL (DUF1145 family)